MVRHQIAAVLGVISVCLGKNEVLGAVDAMRGSDYELVGYQGASADYV